jgi:hypothetical protein
MLEKDMEELIARHPEEFFPRHDFRLVGRQGVFPGVGRYDLLFQDRHGMKILMELKAVPARYADADQLAKYNDALRMSGHTEIMLWLVATSIQFSVVQYLDRLGIEHSEIHPAEYMKVAEKHGFRFTAETAEFEAAKPASDAGVAIDESAIDTATSREPQATNGGRRMSRYRGTTVYIHVLAELVRAAQYRGLTTYQDVAVIMGLPQRGSHMGREIGEILGEIVEDEVSAGRPMLSAVIVGVSGRPGPGFFVFAREIGRMDASLSEDEFWRQEREAVYAAWRRPLPKTS